ncbi:MAG: hypothetical protein WBC06_06915 [Chitinophagaceae bacterium]
MKTHHIISILLVLILNVTQVFAQEPVDSVRYQQDSAIIPETDPTVLFFQENEKLTDEVFAKTILITKLKKSVKLSAFLKAEDKMYPEHVLADLDSDGIKELVIYDFTGGAHCCDEIYIFKRIAANKYQHVVKLFAGNTIITPEKEFAYGFHEQFGYFFTCFACRLEDTGDAGPVSLSHIILKYKKGKMSVAPGDVDLKSTIRDNLGKLSELPFEKIDPDLGHDNGFRKEYALNLAVYYYSFGRNLLETQKLFYKYYKFPDAKKVWAAFSKNLLEIRKSSDF